MLSVSSFGLLTQPNTQVQTHKPASQGSTTGGVCLLPGVGAFTINAMRHTLPAAALYLTPDALLVAAATRQPSQGLAVDGRTGLGNASLGAAAKATRGEQRAYTDSIGIPDEGGNRLDNINSYRGYASDTLNGSDVNTVNNRIDQSRSRERLRGRLHQRRT
jgi:hypothetical protein